MTPLERIHLLIDRGFIHAHEIATCMVERDVANGEYEGCSPELDMAYTEYLRLAERELERWPA